MSEKKEKRFEMRISGDEETRWLAWANSPRAGFGKGTDKFGAFADFARFSMDYVAKNKIKKTP